MRPESAFIVIVFIFNRLCGKRGGWPFGRMLAILNMGLCSRLSENRVGREYALAGMIQWETDLGKALARAGSQGKTVLTFFHNPA